MADATRKRAPSKKKAAKRPPKLPTLQEALGWVGQRVDGTGGRTIGRVAAIHVDSEDGEPRWVIVRLGPIRGCTGIPFDHVAPGAGRVWAPYERDWVREAPRFRANEALTADNEMELCAHWSIREGKGRAAEVAERPPDEITAVPAEDR